MMSICDPTAITVADWLLIAVKNEIFFSQSMIRETEANQELKVP